MTNEYARRWLASLMSENPCAERTNEALARGMAALDYRIPMKLLPDDRYYGVGRCPRCKVVFMNRDTPFCGNCGQALDYGEEDGPDERMDFCEG